MSDKNTIKAMLSFVALYEEIISEMEAESITNGELTERALALYNEVKDFDKAGEFSEWLNGRTERQLVTDVIDLSAFADSLKKAIGAFRSVAIGKLAGFPDAGRHNFGRCLVVLHNSIVEGEVDVTTEEGSLFSLQLQVGGYIESIMQIILQNGSRIFFVVNEEPDRSRPPTCQTTRHGALYGPVVVYRADEDGKAVGLMDEDIALLDLRLDKTFPIPLLLVGEPL